MIDEIWFASSPNVATSYNNIGSVCDSQGRYEEALEEYGKCLKIRVDKLGHEHPDVANSYQNIAEIYNKQDRNQEALAQCDAALTLLIQCHNEHHLDIADLRILMGKIHCDQQHYADAKQQYDTALAIFSKHPDNSRPERRAALQLRIGELAGRQNNDWDAAADGITRALTSNGNIFGPQHPSLAECHCHLAWVECRRSGGVDVDKCKAHLLRALETKFLWTQRSFLTSEDAFASVRQSAWFQSLLDQAGDA